MVPRGSSGEKQGDEAARELSTDAGKKFSNWSYGEAASVLFSCETEKLDCGAPSCQVSCLVAKGHNTGTPSINFTPEDKTRDALKALPMAISEVKPPSPPIWDIPKLLTNGSEYLVAQNCGSLL
ncbi:hypothetical protein E5288_WYG015584 [Bos mutus]|uniref:Uncharacterized protein n=1 Tax=Bos mutus TaxID=72004 RepID=A0A6B0S0V4_9CETA|nr:hypothetical protein [Bos mutus]